MSIIRVKRPNHFSIISNAVFADNQLSFQSMGLLSYLLSKPDDWTVSVDHLVKVTEGTSKKTGREGLYNILKELKHAGFVHVQKHASGKVTYTVHDEPHPDKPDKENPDEGMPDTADPDEAKPNQAEPTLLNTEYKQTLNRTNKTCAQSADDPAAFHLLSKSGEYFPVTDDYLSELTNAFPQVNVRAELAKAAQWLNANPPRRKTLRGMRRFVSNWLSRSERFASSSQPAMNRQEALEARNAQVVSEWLQEKFGNVYDQAS
ncbi:hypothetical protein NF212_06340 [Parasalinivibrio latis]|uniref:hypothetical protein n=1 Tax=Parasalinivibrio latis TaxID=2952610 RepID=UPI0030E39F42